MIKRQIRTIYDIGIKRIFSRLKYEFKRVIDKLIFNKITILLFHQRSTFPEWKNIFNSKIESLKRPKNLPYLNHIFITINNKTRKLYFPLKWNNNNYSRLWQFHLHYFDWMKTWLDKRLNEDNDINELYLVGKLIDSWIDNNLIGTYDGWHSYTISLRTRNWIWLFNFYPELATPKRLSSLWTQLCWLEKHPEYCHGGNHWLENLIALALGGVQFECARAKNMHSKALIQLEKELAYQILDDGGHEERSASYHFLILERLVELGCILRISSEKTHPWLQKAIYKMLEWSKEIQLEKYNLPRFNDSATVSPEIIKEILSFASSYLDEKDYGCFGLKLKQLNSSSNDLKKTTLNNINKEPTYIKDLSNTGWTIIKHLKWDLVFKCGVPCPKHLPAHAHSDLLSFDLFYDGIPVLAEAGTSTYRNSKARIYERSTPSHNVLQLGKVYKANRFTSEKIDWIDPVEIWGGFRAGRKAKPLKRNFGHDAGGKLWVEGEHDGFKQWGARHNRLIEILPKHNSGIILYISDQLKLKNKTAWRFWWHLGSDQSDNILYPLIEQIRKDFSIKVTWINTWYSIGFNNKVDRRSLCISGVLEPGEYKFYSKFDLEKSETKSILNMNKKDFICFEKKL